MKTHSRVLERSSKFVFFVFFACFSLSLIFYASEACAQLKRIKPIPPPLKDKTAVPKEQPASKEQAASVEIEVSKPDATSEWCIGSTQTITWQSSLPANTSLKIDLLDSMRQPFRQLAGNVPNNGSYSWTIVPSQYAFGQGFFYIRVSTQDGSSLGESDLFMVGKELFLRAPQSQHTWRKGNSYDIRWFQGCATVSTQVKIELLNASKQLVTTIAASMPVRSGGNYHGNLCKWTVPTNLPSGTYWIRITTADGQFMSENSFKIADPSS